jgi:hypothetical protein
MLALRQNCIHPTTKQPYILDSSGGRDNSPEGHQVVIHHCVHFASSGLIEMQGGFSHGFVSHFANEEDRRYYLEEDPAHLAFVKSVSGIVQNVRVVDYTPGKF